MPIDFGLFLFASPPRTATTWIKHAADRAGLKGGGRVHDPHDGDPSRIRLSTVRHPVDWLRSYYQSIWPGQIQIDLVDDLRKTCTGAESFDDFVRKYLARCWTVGGMFGRYGADVVVRVEDLPWAFVNFLEPLTSRTRLLEQVLLVPSANMTRAEKQVAWNPSLRDRVIEKELDMIERYEYQVQRVGRWL